jgi:hypothetical protein
MKKVVRKCNVKDQPTDLSFWRSKSYEERLEALEEIRQEYNSWRYDAQPVDFIDVESLKKNKRATGRAQDIADAEHLES